MPDSPGSAQRFYLDACNTYCPMLHITTMSETQWKAIPKSLIAMAENWRKENGWSRPQLAAMTGYSPEAIYWFERGCTPPNRNGRKGFESIRPWVWRRYMLACMGLEIVYPNIKPWFKGGRNGISKAIAK